MRPGRGSCVVSAVAVPGVKAPAARHTQRRGTEDRPGAGNRPAGESNRPGLYLRQEPCGPPALPVTTRSRNILQRVASPTGCVPSQLVGKADRLGTGPGEPGARYVRAAEPHVPQPRGTSLTKRTRATIPAVLARRALRG